MLRCSRYACGRSRSSIPWSWFGLHQKLYSVFLTSHLCPLNAVERVVFHTSGISRFRATQPRAAWKPRESQSVAPSDQSCGQEDLIAMVTMASMENERRCGNHSRPLIDGNRQPTVSQPRYMCQQSWSESYRKGCGDDSVQNHQCHAKQSTLTKQRISIVEAKVNLQGRSNVIDNRNKKNRGGN